MEKAHARGANEWWGLCARRCCRGGLERWVLLKALQRVHASRMWCDARQCQCRARGREVGESGGPAVGCASMLPGGQGQRFRDAGGWWSTPTRMHAFPPHDPQKVRATRNRWRRMSRVSALMVRLT